MATRFYDYGYKEDVREDNGEWWLFTSQKNVNNSHTKSSSKHNFRGQSPCIILMTS